jgi:hypothetical protein
LRVPAAGANGTFVPRTVYPMLCAYPTDQQEQYVALACKGGFATPCQCPGCLTPKEELSSMDATLPETHGVRTMELRDRLTAAMGDAATAREMFPAATSDRAALKLAKAEFDRYSFRAGVDPAFHAFAGVYGAYVMLGAAYDQLHNTWIGKFKRLCLLTLCVYGLRFGYKHAVNLLNDRIIASGKHDGLERCVPPAPMGLAATMPRVHACALIRCLRNGMFKGGRKDKEPGLIPMLRGSELEQMAGCMPYVTACMPPISFVYVAFADMQAAFNPVDGHTIASIVELRRLIDEYVPTGPF